MTRALIPAGEVVVKQFDNSNYDYTRKTHAQPGLNGKLYAYFQVSFKTKQLSKWATQQGKRMPSLDGWYPVNN